jgi:hypothetical protein
VDGSVMKNIYKKITKLFDKNKNISVWLENVKYWIPFLVIIVPVSVLVFISYKSRPVFSPPIYQAGIFQDSDEINLKIQPVLLSKYKYQNSNSFHQTSFQQDPTSSAAIHFTNKYSNFSFFTNSNQSFGSANKKVKPKTKDNEIIYSSLFPNTDLKYTINPNQILEEFIVRDKNTALKMLEISQTLDRSSIDSYKEMEDGSIELFYKEKLVATIPIPVMYELNDKTSRSYDLEYLVEKIDDDTLSITKSITEKGQEWLTSKDRTYPIVIDLVIDNADTAASWISSDTISSTVSQETTIKQEGTGSVKVATTAESSTNVDLMEYSTDAAAQAAYVTNESGISASGGTITYDGAYTIHTFDVNDTFVVNTGSGNVETLVVGGGGGTGSYYQGGGGGGGGIVYHSGYSVTTGSYPITVGVGGSGSIIGAQTQASGGNSVFGNMTAYGGGRGGSAGVARSNGGSAGGPSHAANQAASTATQGVNGTARYGNGAGANTGSSSPFSAPGGGGAGAAAVAIDESASSPGSGGNGRAFSISGSSVYYGGGGGGSNRGSTTGSGGLGGGGATGVSGTANTGGGGGAGSHASSPTRAGGAGGSGVVILRYETLVNPKSQGSYSLEGYANTTSLNKTLTKTLSPTIDLSGHNNINFDLRSSRTGSNIKIGIHDSGGTTTEITPNITSSGVFQNFDFDISGVSNANKDAVDQIIITIVNADAVNTFYVDNMTADGGSLNNTISLSKSATDLTGSTLSYWVRSDTTGSFARFQFGETVSSEQTSSFTINSANTWEQKTWDLSSISTDDRNEVTEFAFKFTSDTSGAILYFDDIQVGAPPPTPTPSPTPIPMDVLNGEPNGANACYLEESAQDDEVIVHWTDGATDEIGYEIERQDNGISWQTIDITSPNAESYSDDSVSSGNLYRYKIRKRTDDDGAGEWCGTPMIDLKTGSHQIEGFKIEGVRLD